MVAPRVVAAVSACSDTGLAPLLPHELERSRITHITQCVATRWLPIPAVLPFTTGVPQDSRTLVVPLSFASVVGLLACPQLLQDDFGSVSDTGNLACARPPGCGAAGASSGASGVEAGAGGSAAGVGGSAAGVGGTAAGVGSSGGTGVGGSSTGVSGFGSTAGAGGTSVAPDASNPPQPPVVVGADASTGPDCWVVVLNDDTHTAGDNCLGVHGWNSVVTNPATATAVTLSYADGNACFSGSVVNGAGWGAVFNLTLANGSNWDAAALGVSGFQLEATGSSLPPRLEVIFTSGGTDYCRVITPAAAVSVPFDSTHPDCATGTGLGVPNPSALSFLRLHMPIASDDYALDFCLRVRAIP